MPIELESLEFLPGDLAKVQGFTCGTAPWEIDLNEWIKSPPTAKFNNSKRDTDVWLYFIPDGPIVGFGSLGSTQWRDPAPNGPWTTFSAIPALALHLDHQGKPKDPDDGIKFSRQILADLIAKAMQRAPNFLVLFVHPMNVRAMRLYESFGFVTFPSIGQGDNIRMRRRLR